MAAKVGRGPKAKGDARTRLAKPAPKTDAEALAEERARTSDRAQRAEREKILKALEGEVKTLEARQRFIDRLAAEPDPSPVAIRSRARDRGKALPPAAYVMLASDWHMGERVRPENVGWRNEYNPEIAQERAHQYWRSQLTMLNAARSAWTINRAVLWLGGDLMTGYIHEEYLEENFLSPVEESLLVYRTMVAGIRALLAESDLEELLVPTSNGNHGRTGQRMKVSSAAKNSFEWLTYQLLALHFADEPRVKFQIATGYNNVVDVFGLRVNFHHGDAITYLGGLGGPTIPVNRRIGRQAQSVPPRWEGTAQGAPHLYVQGHFHQLMYPSRSMFNGSLIGWNDYAERIGASYEDPVQASFVVDELYQLVSNWNPILVTKRK